MFAYLQRIVYGLFIFSRINLNKQQYFLTIVYYTGVYVCASNIIQSIVYSKTLHRPVYQVINVC
jgi:hypothetical protein